MELCQSLVLLRLGLCAFTEWDFKKQGVWVYHPFQHAIKQISSILYKDRKNPISEVQTPAPSTHKERLTLQNRNTWVKGTSSTELAKQNPTHH